MEKLKAWDYQKSLEIKSPQSANNQKVTSFNLFQAQMVILALLVKTPITPVIRPKPSSQRASVSAVEENSAKRHGD